MRAAANAASEKTRSDTTATAEKVYDQAVAQADSVQRQAQASLIPLFIRSASGRQRYNILGAINPLTLQFFRVCNTNTPRVV